MARSADATIERINAKYRRSFEELMQACEEAGEQGGPVLATDRTTQIQAAKLAGIRTVSSYKPYTAHLKHDDSPQAARARLMTLQQDGDVLREALAAKHQAMPDEFPEEEFNMLRHRWKDAFDEWEELEYNKLENLVRESPTGENISCMLDLYFSDDTGVTPPWEILAFLMSLPEEPCQSMLLERLSQMDVCDVLRDGAEHAIILDYVDNFSNQSALERVLRGWAGKVAELIDRGCAPRMPAEEKQIWSIFRSRVYDPEELLHELNCVISKLSDGHVGPGGPDGTVC